MLKWEKIEGCTRLITRTSESVAKRLAQGYRSGYGTGLGHRRTRLQLGAYSRGILILYSTVGAYTPKKSAQGWVCM